MLHFWENWRIQTLCEYKLNLCFLSLLRGGRNFTTILGKSNFPKKVILFWEKIFFFLVSVLLSKCSTVGRGFDSPLVQCRSVFSCVWVCVFWVSPVGFSWISWAFVLRFSFFCMYRMRLLFFWVHFRPYCRSVDLSCISCAFVLYFRSSECTACVYYSFECIFGPTVARSVF